MGLRRKASPWKRLGKDSWDAVPLKRPATKALVPEGIKKLPAADFKRPAAAVGSAAPAHPKKAKKDLSHRAEAKPAPSVARASAEERTNLLREIPLAVRKRYTRTAAGRVAIGLVAALAVGEKEGTELVAIFDLASLGCAEKRKGWAMHVVFYLENKYKKLYLQIF